MTPKTIQQLIDQLSRYPDKDELVVVMMFTRDDIRELFDGERPEPTDEQCDDILRYMEDSMDFDGGFGNQDAEAAYIEVMGDVYLDDETD